jgi:hypothetical protein
MTARGECDAMMRAEWSYLPDDVQLTLSREALKRAVATLAQHAELLAEEMESGALSDRGGPEALRLFAAVVRATQSTGLDAMAPVVGHA